MSSSTLSSSGRHGLRDAALLVVLIALQMVGVPGAVAAAPQLVAVPAGSMGGQSWLVVDLPDTGGLPVPPGSFSVAVNGMVRPTRAGPLLSDRLAMALVVDASQAAAPVLEPGLNGVADFALRVPPAVRTTLVADTSPPAVVSALQPGAVELLRGLSGLQFRGDRQTAAALDLAVAQLPPEPDNPRLVVLYTAAPEAAGRSAAELGARLAAVGVVLAVVSTAGDGGPVPPYWSAATAATGGVAVSARGPDAVDAFAHLATALGTRYLLTFPAPDRLPATAEVRVETPNGPLTADAVVPSGTPAAAPAAHGGIGAGPPFALTHVLVPLVLGALAAGGIAVIRRRHRHRDERRPGAERKRGATAGRAWNIPVRPQPVADREPLLASIATALQAGPPAVLLAADGQAGLGTTTAMIEFAHRHRGDYDIAWWIAAEDPQLVTDQLAQLAQTLGLTGATDTAQTATDTLLEALRRRNRWLLIFDDAASQRELAEFLPTGHGHILLGSTDPDWPEHGTTLAVPRFVRAESVALLQARRPGLTADEADRVAAALEDLPLAVGLAGATLTDTGMSVEDYLRLMTTHRTQAPTTDGPAGTSSATSTATSTATFSGRSSAACSVAFDRLAADHPPAFALLTFTAWLGRVPVPLALLTRYSDHLPAALAATAQDPSRLADAAATLRRRGLAKIGSGTVQLHHLPATQLLARTGGDRPDQRPWSSWGVRLLRAALPTNPADPTGWPMWRQLLPHVLAATDPARHLDDVILEVGWLLQHAAGYLQARGEPRAARPLFEDAYDLYRSRLGENHPDTLAYAQTWTKDLYTLGHRSDDQHRGRAAPDGRAHTAGRAGR